MSYFNNVINVIIWKNKRSMISTHAQIIIEHLPLQGSGSHSQNYLLDYLVLLYYLQQNFGEGDLVLLIKLQ